MPTVIAVQSRKIGPALPRVNGVEAEGLREFTGRLTMRRCSVNPEIADQITPAITIQCRGASVPCRSWCPKRLMQMHARTSKMPPTCTMRRRAIGFMG